MAVIMGVSNSETFVWHKKIERDPNTDNSPESQKRRRDELSIESEKLKRRREERDAERARRDEERSMLARERARSEVNNFELSVKEFEYNQCRARSRIRLSNDRAKPIDLLSEYLDESDSYVAIELGDKPTYVVFKGLSIQDMEQLYEEIKLYLEFDIATETHVKYWKALTVFCEWELARVKCGGDRGGSDQVRVHGMSSSVESDVDALLEGRSYKNLVSLQAEIESKMRTGDAEVVEYWEALLKRLPIDIAKACLREIHDARMLNRPATKHRIENKTSILDDVEEPLYIEEDQRGSFSPTMFRGEDEEDAIDAGEDKATLKKQRMAVTNIRQRQTSKDGDFVSVFGTDAEVNLASQNYWWHDKYRPRKPKYYNRVHTGYEWNKYNQTHYDHDQPPPKVVKGYKFNIFYPDLLDTTKSPTYCIRNDGDSTETCIIEFHGGPPYEDIAFRIVNKDWELSKKEGFKCSFDTGILQLHFKFKRFRYRR